MDPTQIVNLALAVLDAALSLIARIRGQSGLTADQIAAQADALDLQNLDAIKQLLAL